MWFSKRTDFGVPRFLAEGRFLMLPVAAFEDPLCVLALIIGASNRRHFHCRVGIQWKGRNLAASGRAIDHINLYFAAENHLNTSNHSRTLEMATFVPYVPAAPHSKIVATRRKPASKQPGIRDRTKLQRAKPAY